MTTQLLRHRTDLTVRMFGGQVDLVAVARAARGERPRPDLSRAEVQAVVRRLLEDGHGASRVALCLGVSGSTARALVEAVRPTVCGAGGV